MHDVIGRQISDYRHNEPSAQQPDTQEGDYYVSVIDADTNRAFLACGPFRDRHADALAAIAAVREAARSAASETMRRLATWGAWGTCRMPHGTGPRLNERFLEGGE
jgi:hypothetical protein